MAFDKYVKTVKGEKKGDVFLFALSTCGWCRKTKALLDELRVEYKYIDVDTLEGETKDEVMKKVIKWNPSASFPTMVIDNAKCIVGFAEEDIRGALK